MKVLWAFVLILATAAIALGNPVRLGEADEAAIASSEYSTSMLETQGGEVEAVGFSSEPAADEDHDSEEVDENSEEEVLSALQTSSTLVSYPEYVRLNNHFSYDQAEQKCQSMGRSLCEENVVCPNGKLKTPKGGIRGKDLWIPVKGGQWVSVGNMQTNIRLCKTHSELFGNPNWGSNTRQGYSFKEGFYCCKARTPEEKAEYKMMGSPKYYYMGKKFSWTDARAKCESTRNHKDVCSQKQICPQGELKTPYGGMASEDRWIPIRDRENDWVSTGNLSPGIRLCMGHIKKFGVPNWSANNRNDFNFKRGVYCCKRAPEDPKKPKFYDMGGRLSWTDARQKCEASPTHKAICAQKDICPSGELKAPFDGMDYEDRWIPIRDRKHDWVSTGNFKIEARLCKSHIKMFGAPSWSKNGRDKFNFKSGVYCCIAEPEKAAVPASTQSVPAKAEKKESEKEDAKKEEKEPEEPKVDPEEGKEKAEVDDLLKRFKQLKAQVKAANARLEKAQKKRDYYFKTHSFNSAAEKKINKAVEQSTALASAVKRLKADFDVIERDAKPQFTKLAKDSADAEIDKGLVSLADAAAFKGPPQFRPEADGRPAQTTPLRLGKDSPQAGAGLFNAQSSDSFNVLQKADFLQGLLYNSRNEIKQDTHLIEKTFAEMDDFPGTIPEKLKTDTDRLRDLMPREFGAL